MLQCSLRPSLCTRRHLWTSCEYFFKLVTVDWYWWKTRWAADNFSGHYRRAFAMGFIQLVGSKLYLSPLMYAIADISYYQTRLVLVSVSSSLLSPLLGTWKVFSVRVGKVEYWYVGRCSLLGLAIRRKEKPSLQVRPTSQSWEMPTHTTCTSCNQCIIIVFLSVKK